MLKGFKNGYTSVSGLKMYYEIHGSDLRSILASTLIMNASKDVVLPEHALEISRLIPNAELMILPGVHGDFLGKVCTDVK